MVTSVSAGFYIDSGELDLTSWLEMIALDYSPAALAAIKRSYAFTKHHCKGLQTLYHTSCLDEALTTANILLALQADHESVCVALLLPAVVYSTVSLNDIATQFGSRIEKLVLNIKKMLVIDNIYHLNDRNDLVENLRDMLLSMINDVRVIVIKLAIQCYIMRHLYRVDNGFDQQKIAIKTLNIYAPLANRLGIYQLKWELEDLAFRYFNPVAYKEIATKLNSRRIDREHNITTLTCTISKLLTAEYINHEISGRAKHIYSIYKKIQLKKLTYDTVYDTTALRILVDSISECYKVLSVIDSHWPRLNEQFKDYIAKPKANGYGSIHTIITINQQIIELQIRTHDMHSFSEKGIAAHWIYKEGYPINTRYEQKIYWLRQLLKWQQELAVVNTIPGAWQTQVLNDRIFVFTPMGDTISLIAGATPLDFAYHLHTNIGHRCRGAKVNGHIVPLNYQLKTGDKVEIITGKESKPSRDWLNQVGYLKTASARKKLQLWFRKLAYEHQQVAAGELIFTKELKRLNIKNINLAKLTEQFKLKKIENLYAALGTKALSLPQLTLALSTVALPIEPANEKITTKLKTPKATAVTSGVVVAGVSGLLTRIANCCKPLPGDMILGYITRGQGVSVHRQYCAVIIKQQCKQADHIVAVDWSLIKNTVYKVELLIEAIATAHLLDDITGITSFDKLSIVDLKINQAAQLTCMHLTLELNALEQLEKLIIKFKNLPDIYRVDRI